MNMNIYNMNVILINTNLKAGGWVSQSERKRKNLIRLGVEKGLAYEWIS